MVDIGSYILSGSQGLSRGIDNLGALWRDQAEKEAAQALIAKLSMGQQRGYPQQTLASLGAPPQAQQPPVPQGPNYPAYDAPIPPRRPADLGINSGAVQQGMANEFGQKWAQAPGKIGGTLPALAGVSSPQMAYASPAEQPSAQMRGPDGGGIPQRSQAMAFAPQQGSDMGRAGGAISGIESGGRYDALGPVTKGDRAYGKYQVMGANIPNWTAKYYGQPLSPAEFLANPQAQEAVFQGEFGRLSAKYGPEGASRAWFAGEGGMNDPNRRDVLGTSVAQYGSKFANAYSGGAPSQAQTNPLANVAPMGQQPQTLAMMGNVPQQSIDMGTLAALATNKYGAPIANAIMTRQLARDPIAQQLQMIELQKANMGLQNFPMQQQMLNEQLRAAQLGNQRTQAELAGEGAKLTYQDLGDSIAAINQRGEIVRTIPKNQTATLGEGQQLINKNTGQIIAGGNQPPKLTETQSKDLSFYQRGAKAESILVENESKLADRVEAARANPLGWVPFVSRDTSESIGRFAGPKEYQSALQASRDVVAVLLRKDSGAAITPEEWNYAQRVWLPVPGDSKEIIAQKRASRQEALNSIKLGLGKASELATNKITGSSQPLDIGKSTEIDGVKIQRIR